MTGLALALAPLDLAFGVKRLVVATMQSVSGAGIAGPRAIDLLDNVVPYIANEEEKIEAELGKILGRATAAGFASAEIVVFAYRRSTAIWRRFRWSSGRRRHRRRPWRP